MKDWKLGDLNKSMTYIAPILGLNKDGTVNSFSYKNFYGENDLVTRNFINCFIGDDTVSIDDKVLMLYRFSAKLEFIDFEERLQEHSLFEDQYDTDKKHVIYVFNVPDLVKNDLKLIKEGRYSEISDFYKKQILRFLGFDKYQIGDKDNKVGNVLNKHEEAFLFYENKYEIKIPRDMEALNKFVRKEEYYQEEYREKETLVGDIDL